MELLADPNALRAFLTPSALESVLGIDNIIFISIRSGVDGQCHVPPRLMSGPAVAA